MDKQPTMIILCGLPRVGKSSWIKKNKGNACIVSPDDIRQEMFGHQFHAPANQFVFGIAEGMATLLLKQGHDVIIDATNINTSSRAIWGNLAKKCKAKSKLVWVYASKNPVINFNACLEHNHLSSESTKLPIEALTKMALYFYPPDSILEAGSFDQIIGYHSVHKRKLPPSQRINIFKDDDIISVADKWRKIWRVAENKEQGF